MTALLIVCGVLGYLIIGVATTTVLMTHRGVFDDDAMAIGVFWPIALPTFLLAWAGNVVFYRLPKRLARRRK